MDLKKAKKAKMMAKDFLTDVAIEDREDEMDELENRLDVLQSEIDSLSTPDLQPEDGYVTPMHRIGVVPSATYSLGNQLDGYSSRVEDNVII